MQLRVKNLGPGDVTLVEVVDPSDGAVTHFAHVAEQQQITVTATSADSPADIEFGEVEAIPAAEEAPEVENQGGATTDAPVEPDEPETDEDDEDLDIKRPLDETGEAEQPA